MPYIGQKDRDRLKSGYEPLVPGELNFCLTKMCLQYLATVGGLRPHYIHYNDVIGVLECIKLELYRRIISDYEDKKKEENGDVYCSK